MMIEDKATEKLKRRLQDAGLIVNAGADQKKSSPADAKSQPPKKKQGKN